MKKDLGAIKQNLFALLKKDAFFKKQVVLSSGKISNYYLDVRRVSLSAQGSYWLAEMIWDIIQKDKPTAFGGPTLGADPIIGGLLCLSAQKGEKLKGFIVRQAPKKHGRQNLIEGKELTKSDRVILVDDVATSGGSLVRALEVLNKEKIKVLKAIVVVDRQEGGEETLKALGCPLIALFKAGDFLNK